MWWVGMDVTRTGGCIHHGSWLCNQKDAAQQHHTPGFAPESGRVWDPPGYNLRAIPQLPTRDGVLPIGPD